MYLIMNQVRIHTYVCAIKNRKCYQLCKNHPSWYILLRVIPYQFTKVLQMTPSELDEIWCVGSPGGHMCPKGISPPLLVWFPRNESLNILLFCYFSVPVTIQSIITWAIFIVLKNKLHHFEAQRISFHLVY